MFSSTKCNYLNQSAGRQTQFTALSSLREVQPGVTVDMLTAGINARCSQESCFARQAPPWSVEAVELVMEYFKNTNTESWFSAHLFFYTFVDMVEAFCEGVLGTHFFTCTFTL